MIKQVFIINYEGEEHTVKYSCNTFIGKITIDIDGDVYNLKSKFLFVGIGRREALMIGGGRAVIDIANSGRAKIIMHDADVTEK